MQIPTLHEYDLVNLAQSTSWLQWDLIVGWYRERKILKSLVDWTCVVLMWILLDRT